MGLFDNIIEEKKSEDMVKIDLNLLKMPTALVSFPSSNCM